MTWPMGDRLQLAQLIVAVAAIVIGVIVAIIPQKVGCLVRLTSCGESVNSGTQPSYPVLVTPQNVDRDSPYYVPEPQPHAVSGQAPVIGLDVSSFVNAGRPVVLNLSGSGFFAFSMVRVTWFTPEGKVYQSEDIPTDDRGLFQRALLWTPVPGLGITGNDGGWKLSAVDEASGQEADDQLDVGSDGQTPATVDWTVTYDPKNLGTPTILGGTSGYLCMGTGAMSDLDLQGFSPEAKLEMAVYNGSGSRVLLAHLTADALGQVTNVIDFWQVGACSTTETFNYAVVAVDPATGQRAQAAIGLTTR
jgi:hypothetical protein